MRLRKNLPSILLVLLISIYAIYFSIFTINRYEKLYAHYYDLGIMHHTVYNTYMAMKTGDTSRLLELTNPHTYSAEQIKRMAIHNDILLAFLAPFYFIYDGPETLLVIQAIVVAIGGYFVFSIASEVFKKNKTHGWIGLVFTLVFLLYPPLQKANTYEFHTVTLAPTLFLGMYYFFLKKRYWLSFLFMLFAIFSKEEVGLTAGMFGLWLVFRHGVSARVFKNVFADKERTWGIIYFCLGALWVGLSLLVIIPLSRGSDHFATKYYHHLLADPKQIFVYLTSYGAFAYLWELLSPVGFLSLFSPLHLLIALPELLINLLSSNENMRNTYFQYTSVITPFVFISSIYGIAKFEAILKRLFSKPIQKYYLPMILIYLILLSIIFSYSKSHLPYAFYGDLYPWKPAQKKYTDVMIWKKLLDGDQIKVAASGNLAPHFTSRQYFYDLSWKYINADYVVVDKHDAQYGYLNEISGPAYKEIQNNPQYITIYDNNGINVFKKLRVKN